MTDASALEPIEAHLRPEEPPDEALLVVRGGPLPAEKLAEHAGREAARFSYRGLPLASVSVDATVTAWTLEAILRERLWSLNQLCDHHGRPPSDRRI
ncbi:MAG: hypothetical protein ACYCTI_07430 [Acidimicrobiales bacterium]